MAIPESKQRITITIHKETKKLLDQLLSLHDNLSYSTLIEVSIYSYATYVAKLIEGDQNNAKS